MILAVDAGNSNIVLGFLTGTTVQYTARLQTDCTAGAADYTSSIYAALRRGGYEAADFEGVILSSVAASATEPLRQALSCLTGTPPLVVGETIQTSLDIRLTGQETVGSDLIAAAEGALQRYAPPLVIVDMGTATTFTVLDGSGAFLGGAIAPGVRLSAEALARRTGLPVADMTAPENAIGRNTADCLRSGAILGAAAMVDGMIGRLEESLGKPVTVVATGGLSRCVIPYCRRQIIWDEWLLLRGLAVMYQASTG